MLSFAGRDAGPLILDREDDAVGINLDGDPDLLAVWSVLGGVVEEVEEDLTECVPVRTRHCLRG